MNAVGILTYGPLTLLGTLDGSYALDDLIVYLEYGQKREHSAPIAAVRDRR